MPTGSQFRTMAATIDSFDSFLAGATSGVSASTSLADIRGGDVADLVARAVEQCELNYFAVRSRLGALAELCRERADQCDRYTMLYQGYENSIARWSEMARDLEPGETIGSPPYPPRRPGPWADRG